MDEKYVFDKQMLSILTAPAIAEAQAHAIAAITVRIHAVVIV